MGKDDDLPSLLLVKPHVHGPACGHGHDHDHEDHGHDHDHGHDAERVAVAGRDHDHEHGHGHDHDDHGHDHDHDQPAPARPPAFKPAETGGPAVQVDLGGALPGETDDQGRFERLERALEGHRGVLDVHLRRDGGHPEVCVHYAADQLSRDDVLTLAQRVSAEVADRFRVRRWFVRGMDSHQCAQVIEYALGRMPGVLSAQVAYAAERLVLEYDERSLKLRQLEARVAALGYELEVPSPGHACSHHSHGSGLAPKLAMPLALASGVLLGAGFLLEKLMPAVGPIPLVLYVVSLIAGGLFPARDALQSLRLGRFDIETLMVLAAVGAGFLGAWFEGAFLLFLFSIGHAFEHRAMERARRAIEALGRLRPDTALVKRGETLAEIPTADVLRGDRVMVRPGDAVPLDGIVRSGRSAVDQAAVTGESIPVPKAEGDEVYAGTLNTEAAIEIEVTKRSSESLIARVVDLVIEAEAQKGPSQRFTERLERRFVPVVLLLAALLPVVLWLMGTPVKDAVLRGLSLLVAASPCALAISTPAAVLAAVARAARGGVLFKGGAHLESLGKVAALAFDKTGTLTEGKPRLISVKPADGVSAELLLCTAASVEALSNHPLAKAIVDGAAQRGIALEQVDGCQAVHGKGLHSRIGDQVISIGNRGLFEAEVLPPAIGDAMTALETAGQTTMLVRRGGRFLGVLGVADQPRPEAKQTLQSLRALGIKRMVMLSGDNLRVAQAVAGGLGIDDPRAPLLPEGKVKALRELAKEGGVGMVGDGTNDAPALAAASVGVAMGGAGSDAALETADVVLMSDDLRRLPFAVRLARQATRVIRQNLVISIGVSAGLIVCAVFGWTRIGQAVVLHEGSTLIVVLNGLRLLMHKD
jgi:Cd2+/Zn2+-exporting ATPase